MTVTVVVVDDHPLVRSGFRFLAESCDDIELVGEAASVEEAIEVTRRTQPEVVVMDIGLGEGSGIDAAAHIKREHPSVRVVFVTMHDDEGTILRALSAGGHGYVLKGASEDELIRTILGVAGGSLVLEGAAAGAVLGHIERMQPERFRFPHLTQREHEVLEILATGQSNAIIAHRLGVSRKTVANHVANILTKIHATDRGQAIVRAREAGYGEARR